MKKTLYPLIIGDLLGFMMTFVLAFFVFAQFSPYAFEIESQGISHVVSTNLTLFYMLMTSLGITYFWQQGHYNLSTPWWQQVEHMVIVSIYSLLFLCFYFFAIQGYPSRLFLAFSWLGMPPILITLRLIARHWLISKHKWTIPTIVIGGFENAIETVFALKSETYIKYNIKTICLPTTTPKRIKKFKEFHGEYKVCTEIPAFEKDDLVIICPDQRRELQIAETIETVTKAGADYAMVPPIEGFSYYGLKPHYFFGYNIVLLKNNLQLQGALNQIIKTTVDRIGASIGLLLLSPVFLYLIMKVKKDGGPAFYGHTRVGRNGKEFKCWKFRSMVANSQEVLEELLANDENARKEWEADFKLKDDPRITEIGEFIRKTSLDEIPQLLNVLRGEMSLVGPRPIVKDEVKYYKDKINEYYSVRPGVTGLWQASGRNDISYDLRVYLDSWYVRNWSLWSDIVIIIKTIMVLTSRKGAY